MKKGKWNRANKPLLQGEKGKVPYQTAYMQNMVLGDGLTANI